MTWVLRCVYTAKHRDRKKLGSIQLCGGVYTSQRQTSTQIPIGVCGNLSAYVSALVSGSVNATLCVMQLLEFGDFLQA